MTNKKKPIREKGKLKFSRAFQELKNKDCVTVDIDRAVRFTFPEKLQGRTGFVENKRGKSYLVKINDLNMEKEYLINPIHLKKIKTTINSSKK